MSEELRITKSDDFNPDMLRIGYALRGLSRRELATRTGISLRTIHAYCRGAEVPSEEHMQSFIEVLQLPRNFFHRPGAYPVRDPRYPLDMYVPLNLEAIQSRKAIAAMLEYVPDEELPALAAYVHEISDYGEGVTKLLAAST